MRTALFLIILVASSVASANGGVYMYDFYSGGYKFTSVSGTISHIAEKGEGAYLNCKSNLFKHSLYCHAKDSNGNRASCYKYMDYAKTSRILGAINSASSVRFEVGEDGNCYDLTITNGSSYLSAFFR
ncbi:hypothetical protein HMF8227_02545 [Saliniradius amylolyticus]|uniref:Uncharacterized protein n=1 Tax=Saliniradius amylolyticus TaxID=2183582 RepID=A0A2S2E7R9_9ALTE|nr:hypothetical protein HMF8227_02545 [Saliniradius amylolyticus]